MVLTPRDLPLQGQPYCEGQTLPQGIGAADVDWLARRGHVRGADGYKFHAIARPPVMASTDKARRRRLIREVSAHAPLLRAKRSEEQKNVCFLMVDLSPYGGPKVCQQAAAALADRGWNASVACVRRYPGAFQYGAAEFEFHDVDDLVDRFVEVVFDHGIIVLTHWWSAWVFRGLMAKHPELRVVTYYQDREDWFTTEFGCPHVHGEQRSAYLAIQDRIYVSSWIKASLGDADERNVVIPPMLPPAAMAPLTPTKEQDTVKILAMWRPTTPRRGHDLIQETFAHLKERYGERISLEVYGEILPPCLEADVNHGWLAEDEVFKLLDRVDIVLEPSEFHGFGLPAAEAMSRGRLVVSTDNRGVHEYGKHGENLLITKDAEDFKQQAVDAVEMVAFRPTAERARLDITSYMDPDRIGDLWAETLWQLLATA